MCILGGSYVGDTTWQSQGGASLNLAGLEEHGRWIKVNSMRFEPQHALSIGDSKMELSGRGVSTKHRKTSEVQVGFETTRRFLSSDET